MDEDSIFAAATEKSTPEERAAFLDVACGRETPLRARLERLLDAYDHPDSFLSPPEPEVAWAGDVTYEAAPGQVPEAIQPGTYVGPFHLLQQIGEGGMGVVYMAEQTEPVKRRVAVKLIKPGMDSRQIIARFEAERQALAAMDYGNIARVLDAGTTHTGRPYFVMELVSGLPITQYCDAHQLTPRERLELFVPVCRAIQHAHQKGIIHRDIKPSNILVVDSDQGAVPKVIDFGVAKALNRTLTEKTMFTRFGQIVGTLEYMSPEQASASGIDIDTRSDIYSLGAVLYELLTGVTPHDKARLRSAAWDEMLRILREEEPPHPSTRLSTIDGLPSVAANRHLEPARLSKVIRGELDWVVMKALEKDRRRRYETANGLAVDIQRYLADEPVVACPPSATYRLRKFVHRHRSVVITVVLVAVAVLTGLASTVWQAMLAVEAKELAESRYTGERVAHAEAEAERNRAQEQQQRANAEARKAEQSAEMACNEASIAQAVSSFLQNDLLRQADVAEQPGGQQARESGRQSPDAAGSCW